MWRFCDLTGRNHPVLAVPAPQNNRFSNTTPLPPRLHPHSEGIIRGSVARPTLHRPHERALAAESRGRIELAVLQERAYLNDIHVRHVSARLTASASSNISRTLGMPEPASPMRRPPRGDLDCNLASAGS